MAIRLAGLVLVDVYMKARILSGIRHLAYSQHLDSRRYFLSHDKDSI